MYTHLLFDLDGTLFDPKIGMEKSILFALNKIGIQEQNIATIEKFIGPPIQISFEKYYHLSKEKAWEATEFYRQYLLEKGMFDYLIYENMEQLLQKLQVKDKILFVATMKPKKYTVPILEHFHITKYFKSVHTPDIKGEIVKKVHIIKEILSLNPNVPLDSFVMIGDREDDVIAAKQAGIDSIAVGFGYGSENELTAAKPTHIVNSVKELEYMLL